MKRYKREFTESNQDDITNVKTLLNAIENENWSGSLQVLSGNNSVLYMKFIYVVEKNGIIKFIGKNSNNDYVFLPTRSIYKIEDKITNIVIHTKNNLIYHIFY
jgi:hypothetical protein